MGPLIIRLVKTFEYANAILDIQAGTLLASIINIWMDTKNCHGREKVVLITNKKKQYPFLLTISYTVFENIFSYIHDNRFIIEA